MMKSKVLRWSGLVLGTVFALPFGGCAPVEQALQAVLGAIGLGL